MRLGVLYLLGVFCVVLAPRSAHADAIDGEWCFDDGRNFAIEGPKIRTPGGKAIVGEYDRHAYRYTVPQGEAGTGKAVSMLLLSEDTLELSVSGTASEAKPEVWHRCNLKVSWMERPLGNSNGCNRHS